jgi:hypothetical protein
MKLKMMKEKISDRNVSYLSSKLVVSRTAANTARHFHAGDIRPIRAAGAGEKPAQKKMFAPEEKVP